MSEFREQLKDLLNTHSMEIRSNTPDHVLALYLEDVLHAFDSAVQLRDFYARGHCIPEKE